MQAIRAEGAAVWTNPKYSELTGLEPPRPSEPAAAPEPSGELVATFERKGVRGGPDQELRVTVDAFNNHPFISLRLWQRSGNCDATGGRRRRGSA